MSAGPPRAARRLGLDAWAVCLCLAVLAPPAVVLAQQAQDPSQVPAGSPAPQPTAAPKPRPVLYRSAVIERVRGTVTFRRPGERSYTRLRVPTEVPLGVSVNSRDGRVRVTVARDARGRTWRALFFDGKFTLTQETGRITVLALAGGRFRETCNPEAGPARAAASARRRSRRRVRRLWGDGRGRFQTRGRYSAATVRGTRWLTEDRCDGTLTRVERGEVEVEDFTEPAVETTPAPAPTATPAPDPSQPPAAAPAPVTGGGEEGAQAPSRRKGKRVRLRRGRSYVAGPRS